MTDKEEYLLQESTKREDASDDLADFIGKMTNDRIVVFDTETNGFKGSSVLSISAIMLQLKSQNEIFEIERFNRFYYPVEKYELRAIAVNGLNQEVIDSKRGRADYPDHFKDDPDFNYFCESCTAFIGHNVQFDISFIEDRPIKLDAIFDTMLSNAPVIQNWDSYRKSWAWPKLMDTAQFYKIRLDEDSLHESIYDVEVTVAIFKEMMKRATLHMRHLPEAVPF